jgi:multidrug efflux system outer membrane protein
MAAAAVGGLFKAAAAAGVSCHPINLPIFNAGSLRASLDAAKITRDIDVANYEKAIQTAFREVADALAVRATLDQRLDAQAATAASDKAFRLSEARYKNGIDSYLTTLVAQRTLYFRAADLISLRLTEQSNRITLYKVLGGGWNEQTAAQPASASAGCGQGAPS